jgi:tetratricopeptide (TPR) repeat protein
MRRPAKHVKEMALCVCGLALFGFSRLASADPVVVLPFQDAARQAPARDAFLAGGLSAAAALALSQRPQLSVSLPWENGSAPGFVVVGWYARTGQDGVDLRLEAALLDANSGAITWQGEVRGETKDATSLVGLLAAELSAQLGALPSEEETFALTAQRTGDPYAFVMFGRGINAQQGILRESNLQDAEDLFRRAVLIDPLFAEARFALSWHALQKGEKAQTTSLLSDVIQARPGLLPAYRTLGDLYTSLGMTSLAAQTFSALLSQAPNDGQGRVRLAELLLAQGDLEGAERELLEATRLAPHEIGAYQRLAELHWMQGDGARAAEVESAILQQRPQDEKARTALVAYLRETGDLARAERELRQAVALSPKEARWWRILGDVLREANDAEGAVVSYAEALRQNPLDVGARASLGSLTLARGDAKEAEALLSSAVALGGRNASTWAELGYARLLQGDERGAIAALRKADALSPGNPNTRYNLGAALLQTGECEEAKTTLAAVILAKPSLAEAHYNFGLAVLTCPTPGEEELSQQLARKSFARAVELNPSLSEARYNLAVLLEADGEFQAAAKAFEEYLVSAPSAPDRAAVEKKLARLQKR